MITMERTVYMKNNKKVKKVIQAYKSAGDKTDPDGSYTGIRRDDTAARPVQDADDL